MADGTRLAVHRTGAGPPVLLLHGFISNAAVNWINPGTAAALVDTGFEVIMPDCRGHGGSDAPVGSAYFPADVLAADIETVIAALGLSSFDLCGYSLGARTAVRLVARGARPRRLILGGMGLAGLLGMGARRDWFVNAIEQRGGFAKGSPEAFVGHFIKTTDTDPDAATGVIKSQVDNSLSDIAAIACPTLILCGKADQDNGSATDLAAAIPSARYTEVPGNHMTAVTSREFRQAMAAFLAAP